MRRDGPVLETSVQMGVGHDLLSGLAHTSESISKGRTTRRIGLRRGTRVKSSMGFVCFHLFLSFVFVGHTSACPLSLLFICLSSIHFSFCQYPFLPFLLFSLLLFLPCDNFSRSLGWTRWIYDGTGPSNEGNRVNNRL